MFMLIIASIVFAAAFVGLAYSIACVLAGAITAIQDAREENRRKDRFFSDRARAGWRAF